MPTYSLTVYSVASSGKDLWQTSQLSELRVMREGPQESKSFYIGLSV